MDQPGDRERLMLALEAAGLDLWENDLVEGKVTRKVTQVFQELGYRPEEAVAWVEDIYGLVHPDDVAPLKAAVAAHLAGHTPRYRCEFRLRARSGAWVWYANYGRIMDGGGKRDVQRAQRMGHALSLLVVDIDDFKVVNDTWGHAAGDQVICAVAATCARSVRGQVDLVGRIGGEEFAVLLPEVGADDANTLAERLCRSVPAAPVRLGSRALLELTVSIGIASLSPGLGSVHELLRRADQALYMAKGAGKNCVRPLPRGALLA